VRSRDQVGPFGDDRAQAQRRVLAVSTSCPALAVHAQQVEEGDVVSMTTILAKLGFWIASANST